MGMVEESHGSDDPAGAVDVVELRLRRALVRDLDGGFAEVVRVHGDVVYSVARSMSTRPADAEDLASETFLRAYRALLRYESARIEELAIRPWLLTILRNTARNVAREASRRPGPPPGFEVVETTTGAPGPAEHVEQQDLQRRLGVVLAELPEVQRTAVALRHVVGLPTNEVAHVLGCKEGTAKSHISRGLQRLRSQLDGTWDSPTGDSPPGTSTVSGMNGTRARRTRELTAREEA